MEMITVHTLRSRIDPSKEPRGKRPKFGIYFKPFVVSRIERGVVSDIPKNDGNRPTYISVENRHCHSFSGDTSFPPNENQKWRPPVDHSYFGVCVCVCVWYST